MDTICEAPRDEVSGRFNTCAGVVVALVRWRAEESLEEDAGSIPEGVG